MVVGKTPATLLNVPTRLYDPADEGRVSFPEAAVTLPDGRPFSYDLLRALSRERPTLKSFPLSRA